MRGGIEGEGGHGKDAILVLERVLPEAERGGFTELRPNPQKAVQSPQQRAWAYAVLPN